MYEHTLSFNYSEMANQILAILDNEVVEVIEVYDQNPQELLSQLNLQYREYWNIT